MRKLGTVLVVAVLMSGSSWAVDVGPVDQKKPPAKKDLVIPKKDDGIEVVELRETIKGKAASTEKRNLYVLVNPLSNEEMSAKVWWVQQEVSRDGEAISAVAQFGEETGGSGEYFVILAVATNKNWSGGETIEILPEDAAYSKIKIVKRK